MVRHRSISVKSALVLSCRVIWLDRLQRDHSSDMVLRVLLRLIYLFDALLVFKVLNHPPPASQRSDNHSMLDNWLPNPTSHPHSLESHLYFLQTASLNPLKHATQYDNVEA